VGEPYDVVVVGSGPNGLAAAITMAEAGRSVLVLERDRKPGGGLRTEELLEPGFRHDVCSTVMSLVPLLRFFAPLGLALVTPPAPLAHPFDDGTAALVARSVDETAGRLDDPGYRKLIDPFAGAVADVLEAAARPSTILHRPLLFGRLGLSGVLSATFAARRLLRRPRTRALFAGAAAHSGLSLDEAGTAAFGAIMLGSAHAGGWPVARGGSAAVADAMVRRLREAGGEVECGRDVRSLEEVPGHRAALLDLAPKGAVGVAGRRFPVRYRARLQRFRHGPGAFKIDWTLDSPIPWRAAECGRAATVHLGGTFEEIARSEDDVAHGRVSERPFVLLTQPTLFDHTRAPAGKHTAWAYCHVPTGATVDMTEAIEGQIERFAPGFREVVRARKTWTPAAIEAVEPNCVGGDVMGGRMDLRGLVARPVLSLNPYATPDRAIFLCSAATPPGGGVHGMCGVNAARAALTSALR
jgi:phytoene dehydrogenase-like protein